MTDLDQRRRSAILKSIREGDKTATLIMVGNASLFRKVEIVREALREAVGDGDILKVLVEGNNGYQYELNERFNAPRPVYIPDVMPQMQMYELGYDGRLNP